MNKWLRELLFVSWLEELFPGGASRVFNTSLTSADAKLKRKRIKRKRKRNEYTMRKRNKRKKLKKEIRKTQRENTTRKMQDLPMNIQDGEVRYI